jgi:hypothetical protein
MGTSELHTYFLIVNIISNKGIIVQDDSFKNVHNFDIAINNDLVGGWLISMIIFDLVIMTKNNGLFIVSNQFPLVWFVVMHINSGSIHM